MEETRVPQHVAIIMDGNGRWAKERGQIRLFGHNQGMEALTQIVRRASDLGIRYLTVYAFSTENWKRPLEEVSGIFKLVVVYVKRELRELNENNVRIRILGEPAALPADAYRSLQEAVDSTQSNTGLTLSIAINYGGRAEIVRAAQHFAEQAAAGTLQPSEITEERFASALYTAGMPDPDLVIRTGGEMRLSNFLTWQTAYSELYVTDIYWPDFSPECFEEALQAFARRDRRYGGIK